MHMHRLMKLGAKALRRQAKRLPNKRFKDDDGQLIDFNQVADQIDALVALMYSYNGEAGFIIEEVQQNKRWLVTRKGVK